MRADLNRDSAVSLDEFIEVTGLIQQRADIQQAIFHQLDANVDEYLTPDELPDHLVERFMMTDVNQDGRITLMELQNALNRMQQDGPSQGPSGGPSQGQVSQPLLSPEDVFGILDVNDDDQITPDEMPERLRTRINRIRMYTPCG